MRPGGARLVGQMILPLGQYSSNVMGRSIEPDRENRRGTIRAYPYARSCDPSNMHVFFRVRGAGAPTAVRMTAFDLSEKEAQDILADAWGRWPGRGGKAGDCERQA